jgi:hypothetical protein
VRVVEVKDLFSCGSCERRQLIHTAQLASFDVPDGFHDDALLPEEGRLSEHVRGAGEDITRTPFMMCT